MEEVGMPGDPDYRPRGIMAIPGANQDSARTASMIVNNIDKIKEICVTLDSRHVSLILQLAS